jgi:Ras family protein T1
VIVAENKVDLNPRSTSRDDATDDRKRQQIVSLMQSFPFVLQCIFKCSAKNVSRVEDVFMKAQQAVVYPLTPPLYDLEAGQMTVACKQAFTRIFRILDRDHDGLLSEEDLKRYHREIYPIAVLDRDVAAWRKVVIKNNATRESVLDKDKFTIDGFLEMYDVRISEFRLDLVWEALRYYGYDDDLNLHVPESVTAGDDNHWKLSPNAKKFLAAVFHQFASNKKELSSGDVERIFYVLPVPSLPPWHPLRASELFAGCSSYPRYTADVGKDSSTASESLIVPGTMSQSISNSGMSNLSFGGSFPSITVERTLSYLEWIGLWNVVSSISPAIARTELFRLGFIEEGKKKKSRNARHGLHKSVAPVDATPVPDATLTSREIRVLVLGSHNSGKTALLNALRGAAVSDWHVPLNTTRTSFPETSSTFVKLKRHIEHGRIKLDGEEFVVHLVFTDVPETSAAHQVEPFRQQTELLRPVASPIDRDCDLAMLVFDSTAASSLAYAKDLELNLLTDETPRVFVATKTDLHGSVIDAAISHCADEDIEEPLLTSVSGTMSKVSSEKILAHLARCALQEPGVEHLRSIPFAEQKRLESEKRKKLIWLGISGIVALVVVGVSYFWGGSRKDRKSGSSGWFIFGRK